MEDVYKRQHLIPELLKLVDEERIAFTPAVELSYLPDNEQKILFEEIAVSYTHLAHFAFFNFFLKSALKSHLPNGYGAKGDVYKRQTHLRRL